MSDDQPQSTKWLDPTIEDRRLAIEALNRWKWYGDPETGDGFNIGQPNTPIAGRPSLALAVAQAIAVARRVKND